MKYIKDYVDDIDEELCSAKEYAEKYVEFKAKGDPNWAGRFKEMANDELKHAMTIHELAFEEITNLMKIYTPPTEMQEMWDEAHEKYVEKAAWVKQMLQL